MTNTITFDRAFIAPCGINCGTCMAFLRPKNKCLGCWVDFDGKRKSCSICKIKKCELLQKTTSKFCYECEIFPCDRIKHIDKRYKLKYHARLIENLINIKENGINSFLDKEAIKWTCPQCGSTLSVHLDYCIVCTSKPKNNGL